MKKVENLPRVSWHTWLNFRQFLQVDRFPDFPFALLHTMFILKMHFLLLQWEKILYVLGKIRFSRADPRWLLKGFDLVKLLRFLYVFGQRDLSKQCRPRSDAAKRGVWSGSTLFATYRAILHILLNSKISHLIIYWVQGKIDLLKRSKRCDYLVRVWIFRLNMVSQIYPKLQLKMKCCVKRGFESLLNPPLLFRRKAKWFFSRRGGVGVGVESHLNPPLLFRK